MLQRMGSEYYYSEDQDMYMSKNPEVKTMKKNSKIRFRVDNLKFQNNDYTVFGTISENYLGVIES